MHRSGLVDGSVQYGAAAGTAPPREKQSAGQFKAVFDVLNLVRVEGSQDLDRRLNIFGIRVLSQGCDKFFPARHLNEGEGANVAEGAVGMILFRASRKILPFLHPPLCQEMGPKQSPAPLCKGPYSYGTLRTVAVRESGKRLPARVESTTMQPPEAAAATAKCMLRRV